MAMIGLGGNIYDDFRFGKIKTKQDYLAAQASEGVTQYEPAIPGVFPLDQPAGPTPTPSALTAPAPTLAPEPTLAPASIPSTPPPQLAAGTYTTKKRRAFGPLSEIGG